MNEGAKNPGAVKVPVCDVCGPLPVPLSVSTPGQVAFNHEFGHPGHQVRLLASTTRSS